MGIFGTPVVPVVPGPDGARRPGDDVKTGDPCAACGQGGDYRMTRVMERHGGVRMMLCIDFKQCNRRAGVIKG
jgi:alpha-D-ribose 1-methylphosphonate 5-phosphate C-P lyase